MNTKIYSVFPACGKTYLFENQDKYGLKILDSDSSEFSWMERYPTDKEVELFRIEQDKTPTLMGTDYFVNKYKEKKLKVRNPNFPNNYMAYIKDTLETGLYDYIFVSSHESVRKALNEAGVDFTIVYPSQDCLAEWVGRCYLRKLNGKNGFPIKMLVDNWNDWISGCFEEGIEHEEIVLNRGEYLSNYVLK